MTRIKRARVHRQLVAVDSNILWHKEKDVVVAPEFDKFWDEHSGQFDLCLVVPEIVRGELLFQQTASALKALRKANDALAEAASIGSARYPHRVTEARVRRDVARRFDAWLKKRKARVAPVPYATVDWQALATAAVWRTGPFSEDAKNPDDEKGFRDALILETVMAECNAATAGSKLAFVCNDRVLRQAAEKRIANVQVASAFESLRDLSSFLRLLDEQLTRQFVVAIQSRVRDRFFASGDPTCFYVAEAIPAKIKRDLAAEFLWFGDSPGSSISPLLGSSLLSSLLGQSGWSQASSEIIWLGNPEFVRLDGKHDFHWTSSMRWVQLFRRDRPSTLLTTPGGTEERLRSLTFAVNWHSVVLANGRIQSVALTGLSVSQKAFAATTDEELTRLQVVRNQLTPPSAPA